MATSRARRSPDPLARSTLPLYLRQSLDAEGDGLAVARQQTACHDLIRARGWRSVETYIDNSVSASGKRVSPAFTRMLADAAAGQFDVIVCSHLDRLTRTCGTTRCWST